MTDLSREAKRCLTGMFQRGCKARGIIFTPDKNDALSIGKAEVEWDWRKTWDELKVAGMIDWHEEDAPTYDGGRMVYVHLTITDKGKEWREDDLREWRERTAQLETEEAEGR